MTENEFFYWLQGFFELTAAAVEYESGDRVCLTPSQVGCISKHIALVADPPERLIEIRGLLRFAANTDAIRDLVSEQFLHVIDPASGGPKAQAKLNKLHGGNSGKRC